MKKLTLTILLPLSITIFCNDQNQLTIDSNRLITRLFNQNIDMSDLQNSIDQLQATNHQLMQNIVQLRKDLAKMRINQSGKGAFKPTLQQAAQHIIKAIQAKYQTIAQNKSDIQMLEQQLNPNRQEQESVKNKPKKKK